MWNKNKTSGYLFDPTHLCSLHDWLIHCQVSPAPCRHVKRDGCDHLIRVAVKRQSLAGYPGFLGSAIINAPRLSLWWKCQPWKEMSPTVSWNTEDRVTCRKVLKIFKSRQFTISINRYLANDLNFYDFCPPSPLSHLYFQSPCQSITSSISTSATSSLWEAWAVGIESRNNCGDSKVWFPNLSPRPVTLAFTNRHCQTNFHPFLSKPFSTIWTCSQVIHMVACIWLALW